MEYGMKELRCAIIGCGTIAPWHAGPLQRIEDAKLVAVADIIRERAEEVGEKYGADPYDDYHEMLKRDDIDVVHVCTISGTHAQVGLDAISAGKHVLIEKPMEIRLDRIDTLIKAAKEKAVKLGGIYQRRFFPSTRKLIDAIKANRFGKIALVELANKGMRTDSYYNKDAWRGTWELDGGGALMNQGIHGVDFIQYIAGPIKRLCAVTKTLARSIDVEDTAVCLLEFESGALGVIRATTSLYPGLPSTACVHGDRGSAVVQAENIVQWQFDEPQSEDEDVLKHQETVGPNRGSDPRAQNDVAHESNIRNFLDSIRENKEPLVTGEEARKAVEIILAIYHSSKTRKWVDLPFRG
jgi:UDP-N-acetyl-2-amino-2-deoxyglucuronate dehydrogenase